MFSMLFSMYTPVFSQEQTIAIDSTLYNKYKNRNSLGLCFLALGTGSSIASIAIAKSAREARENDDGFTGFGEEIACLITMGTGITFLFAGTILFVTSLENMKDFKRLHFSSGINELRLVYDF